MFLFIAVSLAAPRALLVIRSFFIPVIVPSLLSIQAAGVFCIYLAITLFFFNFLLGPYIRLIIKSIIILKKKRFKDDGGNDEAIVIRVNTTNKISKVNTIYNIDSVDSVDNINAEIITINTIKKSK